VAVNDESDRLARWKANVANGSQVYADVSYRRLRAFCIDAKTTPASVAEMEVPDLRPLLEDYLAREKKRNHSGGYIGTTLKAVRSWRVYNGKPPVEGLRIPNTTLTPRVDDEQMPTPEELRRVLLAAKPNEWVSISLMAFGGVRPQVIGSFDGSDGLTIGDLPELRVAERTASFEKCPTIVRVRAKNSKTKNAYFTFLGEEGCIAVKQYLEQRMIGGETIDVRSDLVHPERSHKKFVTTTNVGDGIRRAMRAAGLDQRPYVWRAYFLSRLLEAQNAGKITDRYSEFFAGHKGDVTAKYYTTGRMNLATSLVEDMREAYRRCEPFLSTIPSHNQKDAQSKMAKLMLMGLGYTEEELASVDFENLDVAEFQALVTKKVSGRGSPAKQQLVESRELPRYLEQGWTVVTTVNDHQVVLNPPTSR
jgi:integrase